MVDSVRGARPQPAGRRLSSLFTRRQLCEHAIECLQVHAIETSELGGRLTKFLEQFRSRRAAFPGEHDQLDPPVLWNRAWRGRRGDRRLRFLHACVRSVQMELVTDLTLVLVAALAGGFLAQRLAQPLIVGYIVAGIVVGPFTGGLTVVNVHDIEQLAEIGVALLLFSLGLEVSFRELAPVRAVALGGGTIQIVLTIAMGVGLALMLGWSWRPALWFGSLIALSSTMVVLKTIQAQGRLGTLSSRVMLGILVVQDLAVVPLMIILPELGNPTGGAVRVIAA